MSNHHAVYLKITQYYVSIKLGGGMGYTKIYVIYSFPEVSLLLFGFCFVLFCFLQIFTYLFGFTGSQLQHAGALVAACEI